MKVEMTEREAREKLEERLKSLETPTAQDLQWEAVKAALGLELRREPVLPDRLKCSPDGSQDFALWPEMEPMRSSFWLSREDRRAGYQAACERYNAYPALRRAAEMLAEQILPRAGAPTDIMKLACNLQAVLDKGPKP